MGRKSRAKAYRRKHPPRAETTEGRAFRTAIEADERQRATVFVLRVLLGPGEKPCIACQRHTALVASWIPDEESRREIGLEAGERAAVLYPVCTRCAKRCHAGDQELADAIERVILVSLAAESFRASSGAN